MKLQFQIPIPRSTDGIIAPDLLVENKIFFSTNQSNTSPSQASVSSYGKGQLTFHPSALSSPVTLHEKPFETMQLLYESLRQHVQVQTYYKFII